jgi:HNH endonuclease/AP2 domain
MELTQELLHNMFDYVDGTLVNKQSRKGVKKNKTVGNVYTNGYLYCAMFGKRRLVHRLIFLYHHGYLPRCVDHINGNQADNRIENLRGATHAQNGWNSKRPTTNTSGVKGVWFDKSRNKWACEVKVSNKKHFIGRYDSFKDAVVNLEKYRKEVHLEFTRHG